MSKQKIGKSSYGVKADNSIFEEIPSIVKWIRDVTGENVDDKNWSKDLKDGIVLCKLINKIRPGSVKRIAKSKIAFKQRENISLFIKACVKVGVKQQYTMQTNDLYEEKNLTQCLICLTALGRRCHNIDGFKGPCYGVKETSCNIRDPSKFKGGSALTLLEKNQQDIGRRNVKFDRVRHGVIKNVDEEREIYSSEPNDQAGEDYVPDSTSYYKNETVKDLVGTDEKSLEEFVGFVETNVDEYCKKKDKSVLMKIKEKVDEFKGKIK